MTLSNFVQRPTEGTRAVDQGDDVVLTRRGASDLLLRDAEVAAQERDAYAAPLTLFAALADAEVLDRLLRNGVLTAVFPWLELFDSRDQQAFVEEYMRAVRVSASLRNPAMLARVLHAWQVTAELIASPERQTAISTSLEEGELIEVERP